MKLVKESLEGNGFGYYTMANGLDMLQTIIPELRKNKIHFKFDAYSNFMVIQADDEEQAELIGQIIEEIGEGDRWDGEPLTDDGILVTQEIL
jgi:hypothetical protein